MFKKSGDVTIEAVLTPAGDIVEVRNDQGQVAVGEEPYLKTLFSSETLGVHVVDGPYVRRTYSTDFNVSGHGFVYDFIPKDEVWLDSSVEPSELNYALIHVLTERLMMSDEHNPCDHETAHKHASEVEIEYRNASDNMKTVRMTNRLLAKSLP